MPYSVPAALVTLALAGLPASSAAHTIVQPIAGIGTSLADVYGDGSAVSVASSVRSVTYERLRFVHDGDRDYWELTGSVQGTGWGGEWQELGGPNPIIDATSHYAYDIPFVLRWHVLWDGTLVYYGHGRTSLAFLALADGTLGANSEGRAQEVEGRFVSDAMLSLRRRHAFFAANLGGLRRDGTFSMLALDGPFAGQPLAATVDAVLARDLARVAKRLLTQFTGRTVKTTVGTGYSAGALVAQFLDSGQSIVLDDERFGTRLLTGGDYNTPYDPASGRIFDAFVTLAGGEVTVNPAFPLAAPMLMIGGEAEFSGTDSLLYARRVKRAGIDLNSALRVYQVRNLPHSWAEIASSTPNLNQFAADLFGAVLHTDGDRMAPVAAAVIDRAVEWVQRGTPAPPSRIEGTGVDLDGNGAPDALSIPYANGGAATLIPAVDDSSLDSYVGFQFDTTGTPLVARYLETIDVLPHAPALSLPTVACRLGGYVISDQFSDAQLVPFADMFAHWKSFGQYRACVSDAVRGLAATGLYDPALAPDAGAARPLFAR